MKPHPNSREVLAGAAAVVAAAAVPLPVIAVPVVPEPVALAPVVRPLWPTDTREQRPGWIDRTMLEHIAETEAKANGDMTTEDLFDRMRPLLLRSTAQQWRQRNREGL